MSDPRSGRGDARRGSTGRTPAGFPTEDRRTKRPPRPVLVEVGTALLIVAGFMSLFTSLDAVISIAGSQEPDLVLLALFLFIGVGTIAVGIALRYGHWWLFGLNYVAVAAFLELTSGTAQGLLFGAIDLFVVVVLLTQRPWFAWKPEDEPGTPDPADA